MKHGPALPVVNRAGRGFHPRPERSTPAKYLLGFSLSTFYCRCSKSSSRLYRSSKSSDRLCRSPTMPVGGCPPDRNDPPPQEQRSGLPPGAGRGLNPRPERSTPARAWNRIPPEKKTSSFRNFHPARAQIQTSETNATARDENACPCVGEGPESPTPCRQRFRTFSFRQRQRAMPESCARGMKIPE